MIYGGIQFLDPRRKGIAEINMATATFYRSLAHADTAHAKGDRCFHRDVARVIARASGSARLQMSTSDFWRLLEFPRLGRFSVDILLASERYFTIYRDLLFLV